MSGTTTKPAPSAKELYRERIARAKQLSLEISHFINRAGMDAAPDWGKAADMERLVHRLEETTELVKALDAFYND